MREIPFLDIENIAVGHAEDFEAKTGCTVLICEDGAVAGLDVRGGGPASRESELLKPTSSCEKINAVLLSGGSAFGLDAAGGVMQWLEEQGIGFDARVAKVPLVCSSCIFDLFVGDPSVRPDKKMGYKACENSRTNNITQGQIGVGVGATAGKLCGIDKSSPSGIGSYAVQIGDIKLGAMVVVNAIGDVYDIDNLECIAGMKSDDKKSFSSTEKFMFENIKGEDNVFASNTTLAVVVTNAKFDKTKMNKLAAMAQNGLARTIRPVHTSADGDSVYALSVGDKEANLDVLGTLASNVLGKAINNAVKNL